MEEGRIQELLTVACDWHKAAPGLISKSMAGAWLIEALCAVINLKAERDSLLAQLAATGKE